MGIWPPGTSPGMDCSLPAAALRSPGLFAPEVAGEDKLSELAGEDKQSLFTMKGLLGRLLLPGQPGGSYSKAYYLLGHCKAGQSGFQYICPSSEIWGLFL